VRKRKYLPNHVWRHRLPCQAPPALCHSLVSFYLTMIKPASFSSQDFKFFKMLNVHSQLTMALHGCPSTVDDSFGPWAGPNCRRGFDFTLLFEEAVLSIPISVLFLLVLPCQIRQLVKSDVKVVPSCFGLYKHVSSQIKQSSP